MAATQRKMTAEKVVRIPLDQLHFMEHYPIAQREDDSFHEIVNSVRENGVLQPAIVRPLESGGYEIITGRRRKLASELAELPDMPCIVRKLDDDQAIIEMVDSDIHREDILPSEKGAAYKMKLEAIKRQGKRREDTSRQDDGKLEAADIIGAEAGESGRTVQRYIRLTNLIPELQSVVDKGNMGITPAEKISYLKPEEQSMLVMTMDSEQAVPSASQAKRMKEMSEAGTLNEDTMLHIMCEQKKPAWDNVTLKGQRLRKYFPSNYTPLQIEEIIYKMLDRWQAAKEKKKQEAAEPKAS